MNITKEPYGKLWNTEASLYTLTNYRENCRENHRGIQLKISDYGGIITHFFVPDRNGVARDIVLGFDSFAEYLSGHPFFGAIAGRFANRINGGRFALNGVRYQLAAQSGGNHLHGGVRGFDKYIWDSHIENHRDRVTLVLRHCSADGDEGYPGNLQAEVRYSLCQENRLQIAYRATTDEPTIVNLTNHSYFNLTGDPRRGIEGHKIMINAQRFVAVDNAQIPTGELPAVGGTYLDCREPREMGEMFAAAPRGIVDHCYVLQERAGFQVEAAQVEAESSGIRMLVSTDNVGMQFYNGNKLGEQKKIGKNQVPYPKYAGFCLETQCWPDAPNHAGFPSCVLSPGESYRHNAEFRFTNF